MLPYSLPIKALMTPNTQTREATLGGTVLSLRFLFAHYQEGATALRVLGYFGELGVRCGVSLLLIVFQEQDGTGFHGFLYGSLLIMAHLLAVVVFRPYMHDRGDVYAACDRVATRMQDTNIVASCPPPSLLRPAALVSHSLASR